MQSLFKRLMTLITIGLIGVILWGSYKGAKLCLIPYEIGSSRAEIIWIPQGRKPTDVVKELSDKQLIENARTFLLLGRFLGKWEKIKAGEYKVSAGMSPLQILNLFTSGQSILHTLTVREGENMYEIAEELEQKGFYPKSEFLRLCRDPRVIHSLALMLPAIESAPHLEGFLFPDTYSFSRSTSSEELIRKMVNRFIEVWKTLPNQNQSTGALSAFQIVTLASIIEKETGAVHERPLISSVFHNRLKKKMRLQSDPTIIYGIWEKYKGNIRRSDLQTPTQYNTYTLPALPLGPIGNPGRESLLAALLPTPSEYLYFVSHNDGTHEFSKTLADHNSAVKRFQIDKSARIGKSWRDLSKKQSNAKQN